MDTKQQYCCVSTLIQSIFCWRQRAGQCLGSVSESVIQKTVSQSVSVRLQADLRQYNKDLHSLSPFTALHGWPVLSCSASQQLPASQFNWWDIRQPQTWQPAGQFRLRNRLLAKSFKERRQWWIVCTSSTLPATFVSGLPKSMNNQNRYIQTQKQSGPQLQEFLWVMQFCRALSGIFSQCWLTKCTLFFIAFGRIWGKFA